MGHQPAFADEDVHDPKSFLTTITSHDVVAHETKPKSSGFLGKSKQYWGIVKASWFIELLALCTSTAAYIVILVVLMGYRKRPLSDWSSGVVTPNAFLGLMNTVLSLGVGYTLSNGLGQLKWTRLHAKGKYTALNSIETLDSASRGVTGSLMLILFSRQGCISILGALTVVIALVARSTTQFSLFLTTGPFDSFEPAVITLASSYHHYDSGFAEGTAGPTLSILQSYYNGIYSTNSTDLISPLATQCDTGNCTWPLITTLAICSHCTNLTSRITYTQSAGDDVGRGFWSLPGQPTPLNNFQETSDETVHMLKVFVNDTAGIFDVMNLTMFGAHYDDTGTDGYTTKSPWAFNCGLSFCKQTINTTTYNGVTSQNVTKSHFNKTTTIAFNSQLTQSSSHEGGYTNITFDNSTEPATTIDTNVLSAWKSFLPDSSMGMLGNVTIGLNDVLYNVDKSQLSLLRAIAGAVKPGGYSRTETEVGSAIETGAGIPALFARIATSMTTSLRTETGSISVAGQSSKTLPKIFIRWQWLILPGVVIALNWLFLLCVIINNHRNKATKWKTNSLATLAVGSRVANRLSGVKNVQALTEAAEDMKVRMIKDRAGKREYLDVL